MGTYPWWFIFCVFLSVLADIKYGQSELNNDELNMRVLNPKVTYSKFYDTRNKEDTNEATL